MAIVISLFITKILWTVWHKSEVYHIDNFNKNFSGKTQIHIGKNKTVIDSSKLFRRLFLCSIYIHRTFFHRNPFIITILLAKVSSYEF